MKMKGWWFEIGLSALGVLAMLLILGIMLVFKVRVDAYEAYIEVLQEQNAELLQKNADLEEECLALSNGLKWWMGYAEGASEAREAAFRECN